MAACACGCTVNGASFAAGYDYENHVDVGFALRFIHDKWFNGTSAERALIWLMQDGYGVPGYTPPQGYDWSGIRDSTDATIIAMYRALTRGIS